MNDIFKGAVMTMVALDSENADDGLPGVSDCEPQRSAPVVTIDGVRMLVATAAYLFINPAANFAFNAVRAGIRHFGLPAPTWHENTTKPKVPRLKTTSYDWHRRAWTMQESLFSRRKLYLTAQQAYFSCASYTWSEFQVESLVHLGGEQKLFNGERSILSLKNSKKRSWGVWLTEKVSSNPHLINPLKAEWWESWKEIVEHYSSRTSQLPQDRYCAFQGILQEQQTALDVRCVEGLPVRLLPFALGWNHGPSEKAEDPSSSSRTTRCAERIDAYPSWSWTGWSGPVTFPSWHDFHKPCLRKITILGETSSEKLQYRRSGRIRDRGSRNVSSMPLLPLNDCANYTPVAKDSLFQAPDKSPDASAGKLLVFEAQCVALSTFTYVADGNNVLITAHGRPSGYHHVTTSYVHFPPL